MTQLSLFLAKISHHDGNISKHHTQYAVFIEYDFYRKKIVIVKMPSFP